MELAICSLYDVNLDRGLVLTSNIGFQSRVALLKIVGKHGGIKDPVEADKFIALVKRVDAAYADRNAVAHGVWTGTDDPAIAYRSSLRAKGTSLRASNDPVSLADLEAVVTRLETLRVDFVTRCKFLGLDERASKA